MTFNISADEALSWGLFALTLAFILYAVWNSDTQRDLRETASRLDELTSRSYKHNEALRILSEELEGHKQAIKELRVLRKDLNKLSADLEAHRSRQLHDYDSVTLRLCNLEDQADAIAKHLRAAPDNCTHIWELIDHQGHISRFKCLACRQTTDIDPTEQLKKLRNTTN